MGEVYDSSGYRITGKGTSSGSGRSSAHGGSAHGDKGGKRRESKGKGKGKGKKGSRPREPVPKAKPCPPSQPPPGWIANDSYDSDQSWGKWGSHDWKYDETYDRDERYEREVLEKQTQRRKYEERVPLPTKQRSLHARH